MSPSSTVIRRTLVLLIVLTGQLVADEYRVESIDQPAPKEGVSGPVIEQLADNGYRILRGERRTACEVWLCRQWETPRAAAASSGQILYPFLPGQLIGLVRFGRKAAEFRDGDIPAGVYTLRYAHQPIDGNHEGTFPTRDFLLLVSVEQDTTPGLIDVGRLTELSSQVLGSAHPAILCLLAAQTEPGSVATVRHDEEQDWWIVELSGTVVSAGQPQPLRLAIVVAGHASE
jgi:hypothetical protein